MYWNLGHIFQSAMEVSISIRSLVVGVLAKITDVGLFITILCTVILLFLFTRVAQRLYYILRGHKHHVSFHPRKEMDLFMKKNDILFSEHSFICKRDKVCLRYRKLGGGSKIVLLNNGVGTDFYMWLPTLEGTSHKRMVSRDFYLGCRIPEIENLSIHITHFLFDCFKEFVETTSYK